ncbi:hypothetical protein GCM10022233_70010 [Streptomyces shaanxiensis]|uniref:Aminoglycoside phosphotransferase domain-containing protein n=1 Tax=Streptomyces shaanxiensis TaxID=653357 RepID=A0ABP7W2Z4_9ACTN
MPRSCCPWCAATGSPAALKLQDVDDETAGEGLALRTWGGDGAVQRLAEDPETGTLLLERLDEVRPLFTVPEVMEATRILAELLARLTAVPGPAGLRPLDAVTAGLFERLPPVLAELGRRRRRGRAPAEGLRGGRARGRGRDRGPVAALGPALRERPRRRP